MDAAPYSASPPAEPPARVLAALGPKMIELARDAADGAHPYWTTPEHTAEAERSSDPTSCCASSRRSCCRRIRPWLASSAAQAVGGYADLPNYRNNWKRLGFTDDEIDRREPRFIDAVVAWGDADAIRTRLQAHADAGATHVCIQPLAAERGQIDWACLEALAPAN